MLEKSAITTIIIQDLILDEKADLDCITETWMDVAKGGGFFL